MDVFGRVDILIFLSRQAAHVFANVLLYSASRPNQKEQFGQDWRTELGMYHGHRNSHFQHPSLMDVGGVQTYERLLLPAKDRRLSVDGNKFNGRVSGTRQRFSANAAYCRFEVNSLRSRGREAVVLSVPSSLRSKTPDSKNVDRVSKKRKVA